MQNYNSKFKIDLKTRCYQFSLALKSANETKYWLCLLRDSGLANKEATQKLLDEGTEIANRKNF